ncbi:hypothetical protein LP7551_01173 [Roseibium album]|nr:hypothetical protein LP7551_01173 [Roseibium album]
MKTILVAMHLVACQPDLLICEDMSVNTKRWSDMEACQLDRNTEMTRIREVLPHTAVVMLRCRYLIGRDHQTPQMF